MGRGTYDHSAPLDPLPFGERPAFVFTHLPPEPRVGVTFWSMSPRESYARWSDLGLERVYLDGGQVISAFLAVGLVDDMVLTTAPVLLGAGRPLFHPTGRPADMHLEGVQSWPSGFVSRTYRLGAAQPAPTTPATTAPPVTPTAGAGS